MHTFWDQLILNNTIRDWVIAISIIVCMLIALRIFQAIVVKRIKKFAANTKTTIDDYIVMVIQSSLMPLLYILAVYFGLKYIKLPDNAVRIVYVAMLVAVTFFVLRIITSFIGYAMKEALSKKENNELREKQAKGILLIVQIIIWCIGLLFLIDNLGYDITTLVAGMGIGGIAIALAAQTILGDLFSYIVIFFDKPFEIGDFIILDDKKGTVEYIGLKTTRLKALSGEQLICSNTDLTNSRVHNYKRMLERRIAFSFGVLYSTPAEKLQKIPGQVKEIIEGLDTVRFDRAHFLSFGDFSLNFEVVYYVLSPEFNLYMDRQQQINLKLYTLFEEEGVGFAFPTQTLYINREDAGKGESREGMQ